MALPSLYDGNEILKPDHVPIDIHTSDEGIEQAEITRKQMDDKMNDPECVAKRINIITPNYTKENFLATFTP